jgi:predicted site-specific integrase-resolvase
MPICLKGVTYYRTAEVLVRTGISRATFYRWVAAGRAADAQQRDRNGHRIFTDQEVEALMAIANRIDTMPGPDQRMPERHP